MWKWLIVGFMICFWGDISWSIWMFLLCVVWYLVLVLWFLMFLWGRFDCCSCCWEVRCFLFFLFWCLVLLRW